MSERDRIDRDRGVDRERIDRVDRSVDRLPPEHRDREYPYYEGGHPPDYDQYEGGYGPERGGNRQRPPHRPTRYGQQPPSRKEYPPAIDQFYQQPDMCPPSGNYPPHNNRYFLKLNNVVVYIVWSCLRTYVNFCIILNSVLDVEIKSVKTILFSKGFLIKLILISYQNKTICD